LAALIKIVIQDYIVQERIDQVRSEVANGESVARRPRRKRGARPLP
jgi:hypothetical protein